MACTPCKLYIGVCTSAHSTLQAEIYMNPTVHCMLFAVQHIIHTVYYTHCVIHTIHYTHCTLHRLNPTEIFLISDDPYWFETALVYKFEIWDCLVVGKTVQVWCARQLRQGRNMGREDLQRLQCLPKCKMMKRFAKWSEETWRGKIFCTVCSLQRLPGQCLPV